MGVQVHHRYATVNGRRLFYREAGHAGRAALVLLHGFPTSSFMFRDLIPRLGDRYHVIAPDHLGFGLSDAPSVEEFDYTFDALTDLTEGLLDQLGVTRYAIYVQDYGAPIGWRLALAAPAGHHRDRHPERQRLRRGLRRELLDDGVGLPARTDPGHRGRRSDGARRRRNQVAVPDRRQRRLAGEPGDVAPRRGHGRPARQRRDPAQAVPRLRDQRADVPGAARLPTHQQGAGARRLGSRAIRSSGPTAPARSERTHRTPRSTFSTAATSCWKPRAKRSPN